MELQKNSTFDENTMATTVGANSLNVETVVSQPISDQADLMVDGLDYTFDQAKFEEYLSSSSPKSASPRKHRWIPTSKREVQSEPHNNAPANCKAGSSADSVPLKESSFKVSATLSKRARQRQRQKLARKLAKALESTDGVHYHPGSRQQHKTPQPRSVNTPAEEDWVLVKRTRLTKKERAQRRRARAARARTVLCKAQESKVAKGPSRKVWIPKSAEKQPQNTATSQDRGDCLAGRETAKAVAPTARQDNLSRQLRDSRSRRAHFRDASECLARSPFTRDDPTCLGQGEAMPDTFNCSDQTNSSPLRPSTSSVFNRLGPVLNNQGKAPVHERLGHKRRQAGGSNQKQVDDQKCPEQVGTSQNSKLPITSRLSIPQGVRKSTKGREMKRATSRKVTRDNGKFVIHAEATPRVSNDRRPQKKTCLSKRDNVTLGGSTTDEESHQQCTSHHDEKHYYSERDNTRKRTVDDCSCSCAQLIKTLLTGCACSELMSLSQRASVFGRLSLPMRVESKESKPRWRRLRRRSNTILRDEFPEVTINMVSKGKKTTRTNSDPDFTPEGKVGAQISQRMSQLQLRTTRRRDYRRMHEGESSDDENSDSHSAVASDDTVSSIGQSREAYTITPESLAQMLQDALAKQKEELKAEMKTEMELAMQQMRELQNPRSSQLESSQQAGPSRNVIREVDDSDTEVEENIIVDTPLRKTQGGEDTTRSAGGGNIKQGENESGKMKELEGKINALMSAQEIKKTGIPCPYPREWDSIPYPAKFNLINFTPFDGRGSPTQHLIYFKSHLGVISGNEPLMVRSFVGTLRGAAFDWYRRLKAGSINCWNDMESSFLSNFFDDDTEVSIGTLLDEKQKNGETIDTFVKRFRNKAMNCRDPVTEEFILQTCHNNLSIDLLEAMGVVAPTTWKELKLRGEQAERFLKRKKSERAESMMTPSKPNFVPRGRGKAPVSTVDANQTFQQRGQSPAPQQQQPQLRFQQKSQEGQKVPDSRFQRTYTFKEEEVSVIFKYLLDNNKIKLPPITNQEEANKISDPKYCAYHRRVHHSTKDCFVLKDKIQALIDAGIITPKKEKKVGSNMVAINFGSMPPMLYQQKITPSVEVKTINDDLHGQRQKGLVPHTAPNGEILWVHPELLQDEQWSKSSSTQKSKRKGKTCGHISAVPEEGDEKITTLSASENEQEVLVTEGNPAYATRSGQEFSFKYPEVSDPNAKTLTELGVPMTPLTCAKKAQQQEKTKENVTDPKGKQPLYQEKQAPRQSRFSHPIRRDKPGGSSTQYHFDVMAQLANIPARITLYELLRLSKETKEALQEALANSETFITQVQQASEKSEECNLAAKHFPCITFTREDMQVRNSKHDRPLYFTGHIGSVVVNRIQVDPGSAVSIMPLRLMYHLGIPASKLASTGTIIYGFNTSGSRPLGKIRLKCQLGELKSEVTCYVIDAETSYNLLLGRP